MSEDRILSGRQRVVWSAVAQGRVVRAHGGAPKWAARHAGRITEECLIGEDLEALTFLILQGLITRPQSDKVFYQINRDWAVCSICGSVLEAGSSVHGWRRVPTHYNFDYDLDQQTCRGSLRGVGE